MSTAADQFLENPGSILSYMYSGTRIPGLQVRRMSHGGIEYMTVIKAIEYGTSSTEHEAQGTPKGELLVVPAAAPWEEVTRRGASWSAMNTSALAALVVRPSTVANFTLFNNNASGSDICFVIDRAFAFNLVSTAAEGRFALWLAVHPPGLSGPTNDITARASSVGKVAANSANAICDTAMTVTDDGWFPWGTQGDVEPTGVLPGGVSIAHVDGRIIVPPQCGISTQVVSSVTGNTFTSGFSWTVKKLVID